MHILTVYMLLHEMMLKKNLQQIFFSYLQVD